MAKTTGNTEKRNKIEIVLIVMGKIVVDETDIAEICKNEYKEICAQYESLTGEKEKLESFEEFSIRYRKYLPRLKKELINLFLKKFNDLQVEALLFFWSSGAAKIYTSIMGPDNFSAPESNFGKSVTAPYNKKIAELRAAGKIPAKQCGHGPCSCEKK